MNKLISLIILCPTLFFAQSAKQQQADRELQKLEKLYLLDKINKKESADAADKILSYRNEVKDEIRKNQSKLTDEKYVAVQNYEQRYWQIVVNRRKDYTFNSDFLANELPLLNRYRNVVLDFLYNKDNISNEKSNSISNNDKLSECEIINVTLYKKCNDLLQERADLNAVIEALRESNQHLIKSSKEVADLSTRGAENIEKALASIKEKDLKISRMQDALTKKDSITLILVKRLNELENSKNK